MMLSIISISFTTDFEIWAAITSGKVAKTVFSIPYIQQHEDKSGHKIYISFSLSSLSMRLLKTRHKYEKSDYVREHQRILVYHKCYGVLWL